MHAANSIPNPAVFLPPAISASFPVVMLAIFVNSFGHGHPALYDGLRFLLFGCAVGLLRWSARRSADALPAPERSSYVCA